MNAIPINERVQEIKKTLQDLVDPNTENDFLDKFLNLLALSDEDFELLAPGILQSYQQSLNNPNDKLTLVYALNAQGTKVEDLQKDFERVQKIIDDSEFSTRKKDFLKEIIGSLLNAINDTEGISKRIVNVPIEICDPRATLPQYAHISDSGMDVCALEDITIPCGETVLIHTGIKVSLPVGFELQGRPRSGKSLKSKVRIANAPGTIDQGYRGEVCVIAENIDPRVKDITIDENGHVTSILYGRDEYIAAGEKICQLVLAEVPKVSWVRVDKIEDDTDRGEGGFGSTDKKNGEN